MTHTHCCAVFPRGINHFSRDYWVTIDDRSHPSNSGSGRSICSRASIDFGKPSQPRLSRLSHSPFRRFTETIQPGPCGNEAQGIALPALLGQNEFFLPSGCRCLSSSSSSPAAASDPAQPTGFFPPPVAAGAADSTETDTTQEK